MQLEYKLQEILLVIEKKDRQREKINEKMRDRVNS